MLNAAHTQTFKLLYSHIQVVCVWYNANAVKKSSVCVIYWSYMRICIWSLFIAQILYFIRTNNWSERWKIVLLVLFFGFISKSSKNIQLYQRLRNLVHSKIGYFQEDQLETVLWFWFVFLRWVVRLHYLNIKPPWMILKNFWCCGMNIYRFKVISTTQQWIFTVFRCKSSGKTEEEDLRILIILKQKIETI